MGYNKKLGNYASPTQQKLISFKKVSRNLFFTIEMENITNCLRIITLLAESLRSFLPLPDLSRKIEGDSVHRVEGNILTE